MFSWIEILRERKKISAYGSFPSPWPLFPTPSGQWVSTSNHSSRSVFGKGEEGRQKESPHPLFCLYLISSGPTLFIALLKLSGAGSKRPAAEGLALGFYVVEGHCSREEGLYCAFKVAF